MPRVVRQFIGIDEDGSVEVKFHYRGAPPFRKSFLTNNHIPDDAAESMSEEEMVSNISILLACLHHRFRKDLMEKEN